MQTGSFIMYPHVACSVKGATKDPRTTTEPMTQHNYAAKTVDELDELRDHYFGLHAEARRAFKESGKEYWDKAMQEYMTELRAIDRAKQAKTAEAAEATEAAL